jgi:hypothetical protein
MSSNRRASFINEKNLKCAPGAHQMLVYADDVNILSDDVYTIKKNTQTLIDASKEIGLEVNTEKTNKGMVQSDMSKPALIFFHCKSTHNKIHYQNSSC